MKYRVVVTATAESQINAFIDYVANEKLEPLNAARLLEAIWEAIPTLETFPHRCPVAPESDNVSETVRMLAVKRSLLILYTVDEAEKRVMVEGFRHGKQEPLTED